MEQLKECTEANTNGGTGGKYDEYRYSPTVAEGDAATACPGCCGTRNEPHWMALHAHVHAHNINNNNNYAVQSTAASASGSDSDASCAEARPGTPPPDQTVVPPLPSGTAANGFEGATEYQTLALPPPEVANDLDDGCGAGAASLTPPPLSLSNRTSVNNSTENLSYADDMFLWDGDGAEAEEISINSDDCIYAYRGDGSDIDYAFSPAARRSNDADFGDDETDYLEMDFEPDPLSEVEFTASGTLDEFATIGGRGNSSHLSLQTTPTQRKLLSSPIENAAIRPPGKGLQTQSTLLGRSFALASLHLDQIKGGDTSTDCGSLERLARRERKSLRDLGVPLETRAASAHSLPHALAAERAAVHDETPVKVTGAKPKRYASAAKGGTSKSRSSLRSTSQVPLHDSHGSSFDERSVSCAEFRSMPPLPNEMMLRTAYGCDNLNTNVSMDESCLDCLEKEFLANTIGKEIDATAKDCPKCKRMRSGSVEQAPRCRSGSPPPMFGGAPGGLEAGTFFSLSHEFLTPKRDIWQLPSGQRSADAALRDPEVVRPDEIAVPVSAAAEPSEDEVAAETAPNQRPPMCDKTYFEQLLRNLTMTETDVATVPTVNTTEEQLAQALDKLGVLYQADILKALFKTLSLPTTPATATFSADKLTTPFESLRTYLLHESKKKCNWLRLKGLIEALTANEVKVEFKATPHPTDIECVAVKSADILEQWSYTPDLASLQELNDRFAACNVLGKVANLVRQAQQHRTQPRPNPEFILIPQYFPSGHLILSLNHPRQTPPPTANSTENSSK